MVATYNGLSNVQKELLKIYSQDITDNELNELKKVMGTFFAQRAIINSDKIWEEKNYSNDKMDEWLNE